MEEEAEVELVAKTRGELNVELGVELMPLLIYIVLSND